MNEELNLKIHVDNSEANTKLHETSGKIDEVGEHAHKGGEESEGLLSTLGNMGMAATGLGAVAGGLGSMTEFLGEAFKKSNEAQASFAVLDNTLQNNVKGWDGNKSAIEDYVGRTKLMGFSTDEVNTSLGQFARLTGDVTQAQNMQGVAMDLARSKNISLESATKLLTKADEGSAGALAKLGIVVDLHTAREKLLADTHGKATAAQLKLADATDKANASETLMESVTNATAGAAQAWSETSAGAAAKLGAVMDNLQEKIGSVVMPIITQAMSGFADFVSSDAFQGAVTTVMTLIGNAFNTIGQVAQAVWPIIQPFINAVVGFFTSVAGGGDVLQSLGTYFQNLGGAIGNAWNIIGPALGDLWGKLIGWVQTNGPALLQQFGSWAAAFAGWVLGTALPALLTALGSLIGSVWNWIVANGPGIMNQLLIWAKAFSDWVMNTALPGLLGALGSLISSVWDWIVANGPGIITQLATWAAAFGSWVLDTALPGLLSALGSLIGSLWNWIVSNGPGILAQLLTWAAQFSGWVLGTALPGLLGALGSLIGSLWTWITQNGPTILAKLQEWANAFKDWVMNQVVPQIPGWLGNIAGALWTWLTQTAKDLGSKLVNEWIPALWNWITGPGGAVEGAGSMLGKIAGAIWTWITATAGDALKKVLAIGQSIVDGIKQGIQNGWQAFVNWVTGLLGGLLDAVKNFFGIHSPSTVWAAEIGAPMAQGIGVGFSTAWVGVAANLLSSLDGTWGAANERVKQIAALAGGGNAGGTSGPNDYQGSYGGANNGHAGSGGTGARSFSSGLRGGVTFGGGGSVAVGGVTLNLYLDGVLTSPQQLSQKLGLHTRLTQVRT